MSDVITYQYNYASALRKSGNQDELFLAKYNEVEKKDAPCFFWGQLTDPYTTARCLISLSNVVKSSFNLSPEDIKKLKDPIVKTEFLWVEQNDIQRIILLIPNNPEPLLADTVAKCFEYSTFFSEADKQFVTAVLQILYEIWDGYGEMANIFLGTCLLSSDKTVTNLAAEIWINGVLASNIDSAAIGEVIGRHEKVEFAPLKRFTDLASQKLFRISAKHNRCLLEMIENIIKRLSPQPITNLKKLLEIYYELLSLEKSVITDPAILENLQAWQKSGSIQKITASLLLMSGKNN